MFHVEQFCIDENTLEKFKIYELLLKTWQKKINIVSRGTLDNVWNRHFVDSLQLVPIIDDVCCKKNIKRPKILDVGSGGGFPGLVLAVAKNYEVSCVDTNYKKTLFLEEVARRTNTKVSILNQRDVDVLQTDFDIITSRAYTNLPALLQLVVDKTNNGVGLFLKGEKYQTEIDFAKEGYCFDLQKFQSKTNEESVLILASNVFRK